MSSLCWVFDSRSSSLHPSLACYNPYKSARFTSTLSPNARVLSPHHRLIIGCCVRVLMLWACVVPVSCLNTAYSRLSLTLRLGFLTLLLRLLPASLALCPCSSCSLCSLCLRRIRAIGIMTRARARFSGAGAGARAGTRTGDGEGESSITIGFWMWPGSVSISIGLQ